MFANVFVKTLRDQRRGLLGWSIGIAVTVGLMGAIWPSFSDIDLDVMLEQYPEAMREIFNVGSMSTGAGFMNAELYSIMLPAMFVVFAVGRGARLVAGEEEDGTLEILATLPVSRSRLLLEKAAALVVSVGVLTATLLVSSIVVSLAAGMDIPLRDQINGALAMFMLGLEFGLVALAVSAGTGRRALAVGMAASMAGASYLLYLVGQLVDAFEPYLVLSPVYQAISEGPIGPTLPAIAVVMPMVGLAALAGSLIVFRRRDLAV